MSTSARIGAAASTLWPERVFGRPVSREDFRNLPIIKILIPTLNQPSLHFSGDAIGHASSLATGLDALYKPYIDARRILAKAHGESYAPALRWKTNLEGEARRLHVRRVVLADGFTWPELPYGWFIFDGEPDPYE